MIRSAKRIPGCGAHAREKLRLDCILILQCLSTFYIKDAFSLSTVPIRMVSEYTGLSENIVQDLAEYLAHRGYASFSDDRAGVRLDPLLWEDLSDRCSRKRYFAYFVSNAPQCLRDKDSLQPIFPGCVHIPFPFGDDQGCCSTTVATNFNGVYNTFTNRESCCPPLPPEPLELLFVPRDCVDASQLPMLSLWYLRSAFAEDPILLFRRQLGVLYSTGYQGCKGADYVNRGDCMCVLMNDQVLYMEQSVDMLARASPQHAQQECLEIYTFFSGTQIVLDRAYGIAYIGDEAPECARLYRERGVGSTGTRFVEVGPRGSGSTQLRHDPNGFCDSRRSS